MTRAEAIGRLESMATDLTGACAEAQSDKVSAYIARKIEAVDMAIAALKAQDVTDINVGNKWISVEERLPDASADVNLCTRSGIVGTGYYDKYRKSWVQYYAGGALCVDVTHWMPLPEPPKEE